MIELFSKQPGDLELKFDAGLMPIHIDESIASLSAILLNDTYYDLLVKRKRTVDGYSIIGIETLIIFKIKAYLDLKKRKEAGDRVDSNNVKKHKNDVFRLLANVIPSGRIEIAGEIKKDIFQFIDLAHQEKTDFKNLGIKGASRDELLQILDDIFLQRPES
jgi:hypothetical protein